MNRYPLSPYVPPAYATAPHAVLPAATSQEFIKGFVMTACLTALQDAPDLRQKANTRRVLRRALQGGTALTAADATARAAARGDYTRALVAASAGAAGVYLIERLLRDAAATPITKESSNG